MSWQIPTQIEQDIISGRATYRTFQTGFGGQSILPVPNNAYAVIFGYDFSPAGGGWQNYSDLAIPPSPRFRLTGADIRPFETQQISFYTGQDYYPFIHHVPINQVPYVFRVDATDPAAELATGLTTILDVDNTPIARQLYITSSNDVTITVGLIINTPRASANAIPATNRTPQLLTYGGSGQAVNTQTDLGPAATPIQFMQPSPKDYQDFGFGLLPNGASGQSFATPDPTNGLIDPSLYLNSLGVTLRDAAACNYFLNVHYALYSQTIPEQRG